MLFDFFYMHFGSQLGAACDAVDGYCWGALASKSMFFHLFYKHFGSHCGCCL
jgi:hypothetical protein